MKKALTICAILIFAAIITSCSKLQPTNHPSEGETNTIVITPTILDGIYYGDEYAPGVGNYWLHFSDNGFDSDDEFIPSSYYFRIDLYGPIATEQENLTIPDGIYTYDKNNTYAEFTFSEMYSTYITTDANGNETQYPFDNAQFIVNGNEISLYVTIDNTNYHMKFHSEYSLVDGQSNQNPPTDDNHYSTLTEDYIVNFVNANARLDYAGDWWQCGFDNYTLYIMSKEGGILNGDTILLDFITQDSDNSGTITGNYSGSNRPGEMIYMYGSVQYSMPIGTWLFQYRNESIVGQAAITSGDLTITENEDGTYTVVLEAYDDAVTPNKISAYWRGEIPGMKSARMFSSKNHISNFRPNKIQ